MNILHTKLSVTAILWFGTIFIGTLPALIAYYLSKKSNESVGNVRDDTRHNHNRGINKTSILSLLMCFGGGILLATCFVHLIPDVRRSFEKLNPNNSTSKFDDASDAFPMAEFIICCGFFIIYLFEEIIHGCINHQHHHSPQASLPRVTTCHHSRRNSQSSNGNHSVPENHHHEHHNHEHENHNIEHNDQQTDVIRQSLIPKIGKNGKSEHCPSYGATTESCNNASHSASNPIDHEECEIHVDTIINCETQIGVTTLFRSLMIVAALSFHSLFEGLAIGLGDTTTNVWNLFFAVTTHKFIISFAVGLEIFAETNSLKRVIIYMFVFSLFSPIGILIAAFANLCVSPVISGILNALATGSIIYIVFFEVLPKEKHAPNLSGHFQLIGIMLGFSVMVAVLYIGI